MFSPDFSHVNTFGVSSSELSSNSFHINLGSPGFNYFLRNCAIFEFLRFMQKLSFAWNRWAELALLARAKNEFFRDTNFSCIFFFSKTERSTNN